MTTFELDMRFTKIFTDSAIATTPHQLTAIIKRLGKFVRLAREPSAAYLADEARDYRALLLQELTP